MKSDYRADWFKNNKSNHGWYKCTRCGKSFRRVDIDIDHIIPRKYGGKNELYNLQCLCKHCNRSKRDSLCDIIPDLLKTNLRLICKRIFEKIWQA